MRAVLARSLPGLALACLLLAAVPGWAQSAAGPRIEAIEFRGLAALAEDTILYYLGINIGERYEARILNDRLHRLWETELVEDVVVETFVEGDGVRLLITVDERPVLRSIEYQGIKRIERSDILDEIASKRIQVREGSPLNRGELRRLESSIEALYQEKGFRLADADYQVEVVSPGDRRVIFTIDEGDKIRIEDIDFEGNTVFSDRRLRFAMKKTKESGFITKLLRRDVYKEPTFAEDTDEVRELYRREGYKNIVLGDPGLEIQPTRPEASDPSEQRRRLFLTIPVEEGARWKFGEITINGNERFSDELLLRQFKRPSGGWLRSKVVDEGVETIEELYANTGHIFARVETELVERPDQIADIRLSIDEGDQYSIGRIDFEGNIKTKDKVIRRELGIQEGMILNSAALKNSIRRIQQLEFFKVDEEDPIEFDFDSEEKKVDLKLRGVEGERTEMLFGGGFSEIDGFFGQFSFRTRNFLGRGETLGVSAQIGGRQDIFDLSYFVPWFLDKPQSIGIQAFSRKLDYTLFTGQDVEQETFGGTVTYGRNLSLFSRLSVAYSRYAEDSLTTQFGADGQLVSRQFSRDVALIRINHSFDRRDSRLEPTIGYAYTTGMDIAGAALGGTSDYVRTQGTFTLYKPLTKVGLLTVGAINLEVGYIRPSSGSQLFYLDRFYTGGQNSIRGFRFRGIWARDDAGRTITDEFNVPLGGDASFQLNLEYHLVVGGPFRILLFADMGNVYLKDDIDLGRLRTTAGVELRVTVPVFGAPLRFIFAENLDPFVDDRFESFQFSIGPSF